VEELIKGLAELEICTGVEASGYLHEQECPDVIARVEMVSTLAGCLISAGEPDWAAIKSLEDKTHYRVFAGERDSFGWLTGCILTRKGILVFG
jgi:hypothetical protein